jgi:ketosteroid isomerase-like protein
MDIRSWTEAYQRAWQEADPAAAGALFTDDATYQVTPFDEPMRGRAAIEGYWRRATGSQEERAIACTVLAEGDPENFVHFRADLVSDGEAVVLDGVLAVARGDDGRCTALREWWHASGSAAG